uniref:Uncharacterized protein n=1 Tax=Anguilla anguilla TaxID=7936 RepID=A0A0E9WQV6_ANGAN
MSVSDCPFYILAPILRFPKESTTPYNDSIGNSAALPTIRNGHRRFESRIQSYNFSLVRKTTLPLAVLRRHQLMLNVPSVSPVVKQRKISCHFRPHTYGML